MNANCITKSWLQQKSKELGIKSSAIEIVVYKYINQLGVENFPTDDYIKQLFIPKSQLVEDGDYFNNLIKIYNNIGGENVYNSEEEAIIALNRALKVFDESSVTLMPTNDGKYIVRIAEPINKNYEKELLDILAKAPRDSQGRLLAPNGKPSNLTERQYALVRTKEFKDWFGDWVNSSIIPMSFMPKRGWTIGKIIDNPTDAANICDNTQIKVLNHIIQQFGKPNSRGKFYAKPVTIWAKSPINNLQIHHSTVAVRINGDIYLYDMPQSEYIKYNSENNGTVIKEYSPRLIKYTEENLKNLYGTSNENIHINDESILDNDIIELPLTNASKVVDENGEPLVVYHESPDIFNTFDISKKRYDVHKVNGIWTSAIDRKGKGYGENIYPLFVNLRNPINTSIKQVKDITELRNLENKALSNANSDGAILDTIDKFGYEIQYYVKNPNQVKSATANIGTFSKEDDRIDRFEGEEGKELTILLELPVKIDNSIIDELYKIIDKDNVYHQVFKLIVDIIRANNMPIHIKLDFKLLNVAEAKLNGFTSVDITFNPERLLNYLMTFNKDLGKYQVMRILTHELIHTITASILNSNPSWSKIRGFDAALTKFNKEINDLYNQAVEILKNEGFYGLKNPREFISEALTNLNFLLKLALIKSKNSNRNIFQKIIDGIVELFNNLFAKHGVNINNTLLEDILKISLDYFNYAKEGINKDIDNFRNTNDLFGEDTITKFSISESSSYPERTKENADWSDITLDFTESDKGSGGNRELTKRVAGKKYIHFKLHSEGDNSYDADEILDAIKQAGLPTKNIKLNIAGSEIAKLKESQERYNEEIERVLNDLLTLGVTISEIRTGGLTGIDEAGIIAALRLGIPNEVHTTSDYKFRDKSGNDISDELAFKARFLQNEPLQQQGEKISDKNTYQGKEIKITPVTSFANDTLKTVYDNFIEKQRELGTIIKFNPSNHSYLINGVSNDFSITEYRDFIRTGKRKSKDTNFYLEVSGRLGTTHDEMLRDFFSEKGLLDSYTNMTSEQIKTFEKEALKLKELLLNEFGEDAIFITNEDVLRVAATINNDGKNYLVAGTMDMVVIDSKGKIHIVDFKTKRANSSKELAEGNLKGYNQQVNLYKALLEHKLGIKVDSVRIAQFNLKYTNKNSDKYSYKNNLIYYGERKILTARNSSGDYIYSPGVLYDVIEFKENEAEDLYDKIMPIETKLLEKENNSYTVVDDEDALYDIWEDDDDIPTKSQKSNKSRKGKSSEKDLVSKLEALTLTVDKLTKELLAQRGYKEKDKTNQEEDKDNKLIHPLIKSFHFSRESALRDVKSLYIFTDNTNRDSGTELISNDSWYALKYGKGLHYPAKATTAIIRGLDNARPISTLRYYKKGEDYKKNRWFDKDIEEFKKVIDAEFEDIFEAWKSGKYERIVFPKDDGLFNAGISDISEERTPELKKYLEKKIEELKQVLDESIEEKKLERIKEIEKKLEYKLAEIQLTQQELLSFIDDFYKLELQENSNKDNEENVEEDNKENEDEKIYTATYLLSMNKFLTGKISDNAELSNTILSNEAKSKILKSLTLCMPLSSLLTLDTSNVNYNLLFTLDSLLKDSFLFTTGPAETIKLDEDLLLIAKDMKKENNKFPYNEKTGELYIPKFTVGYSFTEIHKRNQRNKLLNNDLLSQSELRALAKATVYKVSEIITKIHDNLNGYIYYFGNNEEDPNVKKDFTQMSRIEIIQTIGLRNLFDLVKKGREAVFDILNFDNNTPFELQDKINFIVENWEAFIDLGYDTLINLEEIALDEHNSTTSLKNDTDDLFVEDESVIQELFGSSIEHWQVGFRQVSAINSLSKQLKIVLDSFYQMDENGEIIIDDLGIGVGKHLNAQEAAAKILYYTQGARSIDDMVTMLKNKIEIEPWLVLLMPYIEDLYDREGKLISKADETFRSLFYSNFKKYFQKYAITFKQKDKIQTKIINESAYTDTLIASSAAMENSATLGKYHLRTKDNLLNEETLVKLVKLQLLLTNFKDTAERVRGSINDNANFDLDKFHSLLHEIYDLLNIDTPSNTLFYSIFSVKLNIKTLNSKLFYLISLINKYKEDINKGKAITGIKEYKNIADIVGKKMGLEMESVSYEAGKMYYSYVLPSYLNRLVSKLKKENMSDEEYEEFLKNEYFKYPLFRKNGRIRLHWLNRLKSSKEVRNMFQHVTSLHYLGTEYTKKTPVEYIASMMRMYFYDDNKNWAYFRVPTLSNKPSEEYIRFERVHQGYEDFVIDKLYDVFAYELDRILAVRHRRDNLDEARKIKNFDTFIKRDKNGNVVKVTKGNGEKFVFLDWVLPYLDSSYKDTKEYKLIKKRISDNEKLGEDTSEDKKLIEMMDLFSELLNKKLDNKESSERADNSTLLSLFNKIAEISIEQKYQEALSYWEQEGFVTYKTTKDKDGNTITNAEIFGFKKSELTLDDLREFFFNDMFASINILQLTIGDTAYYKDTEDLLKRLALIHAPGMLPNVLARNSDGDRYSDGYSRTMIIKDEEILTELMTNLKIAMNTILDRYDKNSPQYATLKNQFKFIYDTAKKINVTDALGLSCLTSHRKKLALFGQWTDRMEEAYLLLTEPELFEEDERSLVNILDVLLQPIKPFVYTQIERNGYNDTLEILKTGVLNKNSEYVIALVDAILRKGNQPNKLRAIYEFMEESQKDGKGIDTIQFESTVKTGLTGVIDLNGDLSEEEVKEILEKHLYKDKENLIYNKDFVYEIPFEDYIIQQNVPNHFRDHEQALGSLNRILAIADLLDYDEDGNENYLTIDGKKVSVKEAKENYMNAIAENIQISMNTVIKRFNLDSLDRRQKNIALSRILKDAILKDSRFGADLYWACDTNEYGEFNIPLSDPIHSNRILQLLNSVIKNAINKQEIAGGPVVQASSWGLSDDLHIRFKSYDNKILLTEEEFNTEVYPTDYETGNYLPKEGYDNYEDYVYNNQDCVAYFECYVPIQDKNIAMDFMRKDENGNEYIDVEAMKKANPKLLEMVGYRIPTESKYSMVPIKVKGFVNNMSGELIMMPREITWLSGSDFK